MKKILFVLFIAFNFTYTVDSTINKTNPIYKISVFQGKDTLGNIIIETWPEVAPKHAHNFDSLVNLNFYDGTAFHRVIAGFMIQGGKPSTKNIDKSKWRTKTLGLTTIPAEFSQSLSHIRGILSAARKDGDINSASSQFFIVHQDYPDLDKQYSIFGKVLNGMDVVDKIVNLEVIDNGTGEKSLPKEKVEMKIIKIQ